ncbi:hypothetical protein JTB14_034337 [Gonioctena quinquepunctata]|nr:hypothetical protein JTB14_034337 [Gonioctena quinquepunctata]
MEKCAVMVELRRGYIQSDTIIVDTPTMECVNPHNAIAKCRVPGHRNSSDRPSTVALNYHLYLEQLVQSLIPSDYPVRVPFRNPDVFQKDHLEAPVFQLKGRGHESP